MSNYKLVHLIVYGDNHVSALLFIPDCVVFIDRQIIIIIIIVAFLFGDVVHLCLIAINLLIIDQLDCYQYPLAVFMKSLCQQVFCGQSFV